MNQLAEAERLSDSPRTLAEAVYRRLRTDILWGQLEPGAPLRSDELRETYAVGISPLREALSRLVTERLVTVSGQRGFRVAPLTLEDVRDTMETRIVIEREALTQSIAAGDIAWETHIVATYHALSRMGVPRTPGSSAETWAKHHREFHLALIAACGSRWQYELAALLFDQAERHRLVIRRKLSPAEMKRDAAGEHKQMMEAVLARDTKKAVDVMARHYRATAEDLMAVLERPPAPAKKKTARA